jgi:hypothetical protein
MATFKDKLSSLIGSQVPDFVLDDHPKFLQFLKTYYTFMEAAELSVTSVQTTDGIQLETETQNTNNLLLDGSRIDSDITPLDEGDKILLESSSFGKFTRGEIVEGQISKTTSTILAEDLDKNRLFIVAQDKFIIGETVLGLSSNASAVINNYKPNPVNNIQELLNFRDSDKVISSFLSQFRNEFLTTLPENLNTSVNKRNLIKNIKSLYQAKGTQKGHETFFRLLFNETSETFYPREQLLKISDGKFTSKKVLRAINIVGNVSNLIGRTITGQISNATAIVEDVTNFLIAESNVSEFVLNSDSIIGSFIVGEQITGTLNDDTDILIKADITGIPISKVISNGGFLHSTFETVDIIGGGQSAVIQTKNISSGGITEILIDIAGSGYDIGDELNFNNTNTNGSGAAGFISVVNGGFTPEDSISTTEEHIILEDATTQFDTYSGNKLIQEIGTGNRDVTDIFLYNQGSGYKSLPTISISTIGGTGCLLKSFGSNIGSILELNTVELGIKYDLSPTPPTLSFFKPCIVLNISQTFVQGEVVTITGGITATVVSFNLQTGLLVLKNNSGEINVDTLVTGLISGATATVKKIDNVVCTVNIGALGDTEGVFINEDGFISESTMKIQDSLFYQDFSYVIKISRSINDWRDNFKKTMHTAGFLFSGQVNIQSNINAKIKFPVVGQISGFSEGPLLSILSTLFSTIFGRRLGTVDDGTTLRVNANFGITSDINTTDGSPFSTTTRDITLRRSPVNLSFTSRVRGVFNNTRVVQGFAYAGPRYETINKQVLGAFIRTTDTNYSIAELGNNLTFGTKTILDGNDNTLLFCSTETGRKIKTKLSIPAEVSIIAPFNQFDNTVVKFDQTLDTDGNPITFDDATP